MKKEMLINVLQPEEIRIAILEDGVLEELYVERTSHESYVGNIYKGRIVNIEPSIQAAFVDFGVGRNGFLHVSDVEPAYYRHMDGHGDDRGDRGGRRSSPRDRNRGEDQRRRPRRDDAPVDADADRFRHQDAEDLVLDTPLIPDFGFEEVEIHEHDSPDAMEGTWAEDPEQPPLDREPWEKSEEAIEDAEEALERELPEPQRADDHGKPTHIVEVIEVEDDNGEATEVEPTEEPRVTEAAEAEAKEEPEEKPAKGKRGRPRGGRGRGRRPSGKSAKAKGGDEPTEPKDAPSGDDGPRLMDSAEHRTGPGESHSHRSIVDDEELSFSMARPRVEPTKASPPPPPAPRAPEPVFEQEAIIESAFEDVIEEAPLESEPIQSIDDLAGSFHDDLPSDAQIDAAFDSEPDEAHADDDEVERVHIEEIQTAPREEQPRMEEDDRPRRDDNQQRDRGPRDDRRGGGGRGRERGNDPRGDRGPDRGPDRGGDRGPDRGRSRNDRGSSGGGDRGFDRDRGRGGNPGGRGDRRPSGGQGGQSGRPGMGRPKPLIQDIFKRGQEVLVQVIKEGLGTKGPTLSTYISIAGRYLVLMPGLNRIGVSRKIEDDESRRRLRDVMNELNPPKGLGFIIRTAGQDRNRQELQRDLMYLARLWKVVARRIRKQKGPCEIYQESDMVTRTIRDIFTSDIEKIWVDEKVAYESAKEFLDVVMPRFAERIKFWDSNEPMFHKHGIEQEISRIQQRRVEMPMGGSLVIDQTEALVAIDVNSGSFRADNNAEETAFKMNMRAAREIARQLRLRDLGGVIVNDFIDMRDERHRRAVERALHEAVARDRARTKILRMSQFGMIEMTRQRIRPSLKRSVYHECAHCKATGQVKTVESMSIEVMRMLQLAVHREHIHRLEIRVQDEVANYLLNRKRAEVSRLEIASGKMIQVRGVIAMAPEFLEFLCFDNNGHEVKFDPFEEATRPGPPPRRRDSRGRGRDR